MAFVRRGPKQASLSPALWGWTTVAGGLLAIHFAAWIVALESTSIALCTVLLATNPLWVAILASVVLREKSSPMTWAGIALAFAAQVAALSASAQQPLSAAAAARSMQRLSGVWVDGPGYDIKYGADYDTCAKRCPSFGALRTFVTERFPGV